MVLLENIMHDILKSLKLLVPHLRFVPVFWQLNPDKVAEGSALGVVDDCQKLLLPLMVEDWAVNNCVVLEASFDVIQFQAVLKTHF